MGTNIYMVRKPEQIDWNAVQEAARQHDKVAVLTLLNNDWETVHIGQRASGWQFLFATNPKKYENNRKSIDEFLQKSINDKWMLRNEYGDTLTPEEFWRDYVDSFSGCVERGEFVSDNLCFDSAEFC